MWRVPMLDILLEILNRLRYVPGLGFVKGVYDDLRLKKMKIESQASKLNKKKNSTITSLKGVQEIPSVLKGSKKRT